MSRWLGEGISKLGGQLTDFTREVLSETTEETEDPNAELQVAKKRISDLENQLQFASKDIETLRQANADLEDRAATAELQLHSLSENYRRSLESKETEIRKLQNEVQISLDHQTDETSSFQVLASSPPSPGASDFEIVQLNNQIKQLKAEVQHWKNVVKTTQRDQKSISISENIDKSDDLQAEIDALRQELMDTIEKHQGELSSLQEHHNEQLAQLRAQISARDGLNETSQRDSNDEDWAWEESGGSWNQQASSSNSEGDLLEKLEDLREKHSKVQKERQVLSEEKESLAAKKTVDTLESWEDAQREKLQADYEKARETIKELEDRVESLEQDLEVMDSQQQETVKQLMETKAESARALEARSKEFLTENEILKSQLEQFRAENSERDALKSEIEQLRASQTAENAAANSELESLRAQNSENEALKSEIEQLRAQNSENEALKSEIEQLRAQNSENDAPQAQLEQLRAENSELMSAYNDLNDEFEKSKAQTGTVENSNQDLNMRLESLKADLIEYEEKYEKCKQENVRAMKQLESLSVEFDRLKDVLNSAKAESADQLHTEVQRLQDELKESSNRRDHLAGKMEEFQEIMGKFEGEVNEFRDMNRQLKEENGDLKEMVENLLGCKDSLSESEKQMTDLRDTVQRFKNQANKREIELNEQIEELLSENSKLREERKEKSEDDEIEKLRETMHHQEMEIRGILEEKQNLTAQLESAMSAFSNHEEMEAWLSKYRELVGNEAAAAVEKNGSGTDLALIRSCLSDSSGGRAEKEETDSGDSNGWDRLHDKESEEKSKEKRKEEKAGGILTPAQLEVQLKEALDALTEKTEECENVQKSLIQKEQELQEREELIQQVFTELKGLEMQINEFREREESMKSNVHKLTMETARKETEIDNLRKELEREAEKEQEWEYKIAQLESEKEQLGKILKDKESETLTQGAETEPLLQNLREENKHLESKLEERKEELDSLRRELEQAKGEAEYAKIENLQSRDTVIADLKENLLKMQELAERERRCRVEEVEKQKSNSENLAALQNEKQQLVVLVNQKHDESVKYHHEAQSAVQSFSQQQTQMQILERQLESASGQVKELQMQLETSRKLTEELRSVNEAGLSEKRSLEMEKLNLMAEIEKLARSSASKEPELNLLKTELESIKSRKDQVIGELDLERNRSEQLANQLKSIEDSKVKTEREVQRLMDHLLQVEENYTREAVASEERETELRKQLRAAEEQALSHSQVAKGTSAQFMDDIEDLKVQLEALAQQRDAALLELNDSQEQLEKSQKSLWSLQGVLQHFQAERDSLVMDEVERYKLAAEDKNREKDKIFYELQALKKHLESKESEWSGNGELRETLREKCQEIDSLKKQLEAKDFDLTDLRARASMVEKIQTEKVDKELLKNLFLGYFTAPGNKKSEVAHLLGSVLSFSEEDFAKLDDGTGGGGWLAFLRRNGGGHPSNPDQSIAAQFVKFLEAESAPQPGGSAAGAIPMNLPPENYEPRAQDSRNSSRSSTPAGGLLRQQFMSAGTASHSSSQGSFGGGNVLLSSASMELPSFASDSPLRPPSSTSDFLKEVLQNP